MESDAPILMNDGTLRPVFNISDFEEEQGYVTIAMLKRYANLFNVNIFRSVNFFINGLSFTGQINNVTDIVFDYLKNVTSDIQSQFNQIVSRIKNLSYDSQSDTQGFITSTWFPSVITNQIQNNNLINNSILTNNLQTITMSSQTIHCDKLTANNVPMLWINSYPIISSGLLSRLNGLVTTNCVISLQSGYSVYFYNVNNVIILTFSNTTQDILYFNGVDLSNVNSLTIFKN